MAVGQKTTGGSIVTIIAIGFALAYWEVRDKPPWDDSPKEIPILWPFYETVNFVRGAQPHWQEEKLKAEKFEKGKQALITGVQRCTVYDRGKPVGQLLPVLAAYYASEQSKGLAVEPVGWGGGLDSDTGNLFVDFSAKLGGVPQYYKWIVNIVGDEAKVLAASPLAAELDVRAPCDGSEPPPAKKRN